MADVSEAFPKFSVVNRSSLNIPEVVVISSSFLAFLSSQLGEISNAPNGIWVHFLGLLSKLVSDVPDATGQMIILKTF